MIKDFPLWLKLHKVFASSILVVLILVGITLLILFKPSPSPVPVGIRGQVKFKVIYPKGYNIGSSSWAYTTSNNTLAFKVYAYNATIVFTEQRVPLAYQNDAASYNRFIGTLRPFSTYDIALGSVSLTNFVSAGSFNPEGESAILNSNGTLLLAHPSKDLNDNEWRDLTNAFVVTN